MNKATSGRPHRRLQRTRPLPALLSLVMVVFGSSCLTSIRKQPSAEPPSRPEKPTDAPARCETEVLRLEAEVDQQRWQAVEQGAFIKQLEQRLLAQQRALDDAIQEVVRVKAKQRSVETRAQAASEMAEAEIALKSLRGKSATSSRPELAKAEQLLAMAAREFQEQNFGGALYLVGQAKGQIRVETVRLREGGQAQGLEGEIPFAVPLALLVRTKAHLRDGPGLEFEILASLDEGAPITGYSAKGAWLRVGSDSGRSGWMHRSLVSAN